MTMQIHSFIQQIFIHTYEVLRHCLRLWEQMTTLVTHGFALKPRSAGAGPRRADMNLEGSL